VVVHLVHGGEPVEVGNGVEFFIKAVEHIPVCACPAMVGIVE
jgi:hypothetical protein